MHSLDDIRGYLEDNGVINSEEEWDEREQFIFNAMTESNIPFNEFCERIKRVILAEKKFLADIKKQENLGEDN